jgi:type II secretory pathway pseudopilin PulG
MVLLWVPHLTAKGSAFAPVRGIHKFLPQWARFRVNESTVRAAPRGEGQVEGRNKPVPAGVSGKPEAKMPETVVARSYSGLHPNLISTVVPSAPRRMRGLTLIELAVVLLILIALAGLLMPSVQNASGSAQCVATDASMVVIRDAILGTGGQPGYFSDMGSFPKHPDATTTTSSPFNLHYLFSDWNANADPVPNSCLKNGPDAVDCVHLPHYNPVTQRGWHGPYLANGLTCGSLSKDYAVPCKPSLSPLYLVCGLGLPQNMISCENSTSSCVSACSCGMCQTNASSSVVYMKGGIGVALDAFSVIGPNGTQPVRSPVQLFKDTQGHHYLVSAGPDSMTSLTNGSDPTTLLRGDDRVLYLDSNDRWVNQPCH